MKLPPSFTTVTPLSKTIAMIIFTVLPILSFFFGVRYQQKLNVPQANSYLPISPSPTTTPLIERTYNNSLARFTLDLPDFWMRKQTSLSSILYTSPDKRLTLEITLLKESPGKVDARANPHTIVIQNHKITYFFEYDYGENGELKSPITKGEIVLFESNGRFIDMHLRRLDSLTESQKDLNAFQKIINSLSFF